MYREFQTLHEGSGHGNKDENLQVEAAVCLKNAMEISVTLTKPVKRTGNRQ